MAGKLDAKPVMIEVKTRLTQGTYNQLLAECADCGCAISSVVRMAIAKEIVARRKARQSAAASIVLAGQLDIEGKVNA